MTAGEVSAGTEWILAPRAFCFHLGNGLGERRSDVMELIETIATQRMRARIS